MMEIKGDPPFEFASSARGTEPKGLESRLLGQSEHWARHCAFACFGRMHAPVRAAAEHDLTPYPANAVGPRRPDPCGQGRESVERVRWPTDLAYVGHRFAAAKLSACGRRPNERAAAPTRAAGSRRRVR